MAHPQPHPPNDPKGDGAAVGEEGRSPVDGLVMPVGPAQPYDVDKVESDRAKSIGPRINQQGKST